MKPRKLVHKRGYHKRNKTDIDKLQKNLSRRTRSASTPSSFETSESLRIQSPDVYEHQDFPSLAGSMDVTAIRASEYCAKFGSGFGREERCGLCANYLQALAW